MSTGKQNQNQNQISDENENTPKDEVDGFLNSIGDFLRLPQRDGESVIYQFFNDKSKRQLVERTFRDPVTHEIKPQIKVKYSAIHPHYPEQGEKPLEVPKTLAQQIEANVAKGHCKLEITRHGTGPNTRYTVTAA
jgi:DNA polymerase II large subunit